MDNFQLQYENGIQILGWFDDENDIALMELLPILKEIAIKKADDVRKALQELKSQMREQAEMGLSGFKPSL